MVCWRVAILPDIDIVYHKTDFKLLLTACHSETEGQVGANDVESPGGGQITHNEFQSFLCGIHMPHPQGDQKCPHMIILQLQHC